MSETPIFAFVLIPFASEFDDLYELGIKAAATEVGIVAERLDEQLFAEGMMERIYRQIEAADIIVAEMTGQNPNVFYEVGYAHAKDKLCILQTSEAKDIPFDLKHRRHIVHRGSIAGCKEALIENLQWAKSEVENIRKSQIRVDFKQPNSILITDQLEATASLDFKIDLYNDSTKSSAEIKAIYFYATHHWTLKQGESVCSSTDSDLARWKRRYFLVTPIHVLPPNSWAQLEFNATRVMARKYFGDAVKDSYKVAGAANLRFVTNKGVFDYALHIDTEVSDIPF